MPKERMAGGREHRVPLSTRALCIMQDLSEAKTSEFAFTGPSLDKPLYKMAFAALMKRLKVHGVTTHGVHSTFRDWAGDQTQSSGEVAEAALAHIVGNVVERAYRRSDALEKRRALMEAWCQYCVRKQTISDAASATRNRRTRKNNLNHGAN